MYFALQFLSETEPKISVGAPFTYARDWWLDSRWMPNIFRDYLVTLCGAGRYRNVRAGA